MSQLTHEQRFDIVQKALAASQAGDNEEMVRITKQLPLAPHLALVVKETWGKEFLLEGGYDLSEVEARYGKDWLDS
jgi:hypothetical protein